MCGLSGFLSLDQRRADPDLVRRMTATLRHRGPDEEGYFVDGPIALGHRRLKIIDLATGQQPVANESGTLRVILNGEIYNFRELTETLKARGHRFTSSSDTEVIVHAYEEYGEDCLAHFNGMFAFVLWDAERQTLFAARDRMGEKPFYFAERNGWFVFGSEVRALLAHPEIGRDLDLRGLSRYLASGYVADPHTILKGVLKLPPGHSVTVSSGKVSVNRYWDMSFEPSRAGVDASAEALWEALCAAVRHRLVSDVPVGILLSGGIDSSAVTAAALAVSPGRKFKTFSIGVEEPTYNEEAFARMVVDHLGTEHHQFTFTAADAQALLRRVGTLLDEPLADAAFLPTIHLAHHARQSVTVALSGDGADELLAGYPTFLAARPIESLRRLPRVLVRGATRLVEALPDSRQYGSPSFLLKRFFRGAGCSADMAIQMMMGGLTHPEVKCLLSPRVREACAAFDPAEDLAEIMARAPMADPISRVTYHHGKLYLAGQTLVKMDRGTMGSALEVRAPFLDSALVELVCSMPSSLKLRGWETKHVLKRALRGRLPNQILERRKQGFGVPVARWLRGPLRPLLEEILAGERLRAVGLFDAERVLHLVSEHLDGRRDHRHALWSLLIFEQWREAYLPGQRWA